MEKLQIFLANGIFTPIFKILVRTLLTSTNTKGQHNLFPFWLTGNYQVIQSGQYWMINHRSVNFEPLLAKMDFLFGENGLFANELCSQGHIVANGYNGERQLEP